MSNLNNYYELILSVYTTTVLLEIALVIVFNLFSGSSKTPMYDIED